MAHADDLRSITANLDALHLQANTVLDFANQNFLQWNTSKCELLLSLMRPQNSDPGDFPLNLDLSLISLQMLRNLRSRPLIFQQLLQLLITLQMPGEHSSLLVSLGPIKES